MIEGGTTIAFGYLLVSAVPWTSVVVRRLHDVGRSGWWMFCPVVNVVWLFEGSQPGPNEYGPDPKDGQRGGGAR